MFAEDEAQLLTAAASSDTELEKMVQRRVTGLPLEHAIGWADFCGIRVAVDEGVFVPRHRSELLVREAVARTGVGTVVVDLCCGSGALGAALAAAVDRVELHAVDVDLKAVACARRNLDGEAQTVYEGDLFAPLPSRLRGRVGTLVVNAPYVPSDEVELLPREARLYEALLALDGGPDGLDVHRRVAAAAPAWLSPRGVLLIEVSEHQAAAAVALFVGAGLAAEVAKDDEIDATVVIGTAPAAS